MSWNIGTSRNIFLSLRNKSEVFHVRLHYELKKSSYTVLEALNSPKIDKLDSESNFSELKWVIHNGLRRTTLKYQSKHEISTSQHRWNGVQRNDVISIYGSDESSSSSSKLHQLLIIILFVFSNWVAPQFTWILLNSSWRIICSALFFTLYSI